MFLINFHHTRRQAFSRGFLKGLAAPVMLYHFENVEATSQVPYVVPPNVQASDALHSDWSKVGQAIKSAAKKHGKAAA